MSPWPILHPEQKVEHQLAAARGRHGLAQALAGPFLPCRDESCELGESGRFGFARDGRLNSLDQKDIYVARCAKVIGKPLQIRRQRREGRVFDQRAKQGEGRSKAPDGDPSLMNRLDLLPVFECRGVEHHLPEAAVGDGAEGFRRAHRCVKMWRRHFNRVAPDARGQSIASFTLADEAEVDRRAANQLSRQTEQAAAASAFQFKFDLGDGSMGLARHYLALIKGDFDHCAAEIYERPASVDPCAESRADAVAQFFIRQQLTERGLGRALKVGLMRRESLFPFAALNASTVLLNCLDNAFGRLAQAKDEACLAEFLLGRIEIGGDLRNGRCGAKGGQKRNTQRRFQPCGRRQKFQLKFTPANHFQFQLEKLVIVNALLSCRSKQPDIALSSPPLHHHSMHDPMTRLELLTTSEMAAADRLSIAAGVSGMALMERAGAAVAHYAIGLAPAGRRIVVLCGPGNNGGDGFVAARLLRDHGFEVQVYLLGEVGQLRGDAGEAARRWGGPIDACSALDLEGAGLVVDGLFGAGLSRDLDGEARELVERVNLWSQVSGLPVVAIDVPSGLDGDTGAVRGVAIVARATVTFFRFKPGHLLLPGRKLCAELHLADIGTPELALAAIRPRAFGNGPDLWRQLLPTPGLESHKYMRGHALVLSGGPWTTGAARLSARAALRAGAGLVTLASPRDSLPINAAHLTAIMLAACDTAAEMATILSDARKNALVMGPGAGVGKLTMDLVLEALRSEPLDRALVLDADALTSFQDDPGILGNAIKRSGKPVVLTPHEGEFSRLFNSEGRLLESGQQLLQANETAFHSKLERARRAARESGAILILKGPDTVIAAPDGRAAISFDAPPWLATAGSGDVLAGFVGGLLAQSMPIFEAACAAVWIHGACARAIGQGLIAEDLPEAIPGVLRELYE